MKVELITHTPYPEKVIASAARLCYSESDIETLMNGLDAEKSARLVEKLADMGHESPIEHVTFTFGIEGVSRSLLAQITRHRIASFSVQSQRYVKTNTFSFVTPPEIADDENALQIFNEAMKNDIETYNKLTDILQEKHYKSFISSGMDEKSAMRSAEKKAIEDARYVLPNAAETKILMTMNARSLYNFFKLRCCNRAQWEIKALADEMLRLCYKAAPTLFKTAGPSCACGACTEGNMSCKKAPQMKEFYKELKSRA
ncbi:MAG: FAD-dependent thymidylate synthase [Oscillospiraceae bacterium]